MNTKNQRPSFDAAMALVFDNVAELGRETVPLENAWGRVSAVSVATRRSSPPYDMSAMDGYAISAADIDGQAVRYEIGHEIFAGADQVPSMQAGTALPISTGAPIPKGCGTVVPKERTERESTFLRLSSPPEHGRNIRREGEDAKAGDVVLRPGTILTPAAVGALASFGIDTIELFRKPRAALLITGNEVDTEICDANGPAISSVLKQRQVDVVRKSIVPDDPELLREEILRLTAKDADIVISTGGVSVGPRDHVLDVLNDLQATIHFHGVAMRPGKPVLFATLPGGQPFFGLPGNPVAALVGLRFFVSTALRRMQSLPIEAGVPCNQICEGKEGLTVIFKGLSRPGVDPIVLTGQEPHKMRPLIDANCWIAVNGTEKVITTRCFPLDPIF